MDRFPTDINEDISFMSLFAAYAYNFYDNPEERKGIPEHFHIDRELTTDADNVLMVSDVMKYVVWSIRGTVFTQGNIIDDINILFSGKYTNVFSIPYYIDKLTNIINKYKINRNKKDRYNIYLSSHSLGANKQQYLLFDRDSKNKLFIENIDGIFNYALAGSSIASGFFTSVDPQNQFIRGRPDPIGLVPKILVGTPKIMKIGTAAGGLHELDCGKDPQLCALAKEKNFIISTYKDPIAYGLKHQQAEQELSQIGTIVNVPLSMEMIDQIKTEFNILGINVYNIQILKIWLESHSINVFNNEYRRTLITPRMIETGKRTEEEIRELTAGRIPTTEEFEIFFEPHKKIIMTNTNIENQIYNMASAPSRYDQMMSRYRALPPIGTTAPIGAAGGTSSRVDALMTRHRARVAAAAGGGAAAAGGGAAGGLPPIKPVERVKYSPFAVPPSGGLMGAGRQGLPLMPQSYLGVPQLEYGEYMPVPAPHIVDNKMKPEFSKKVHAAPQVKPEDGKLKGRPKPDPKKIKKQLHEEAFRDALAKGEIKTETVNKGYIKNSN